MAKYETRVVGTISVATLVGVIALQRRGLANYRRRIGEVRTEDDAEVTLSLLGNLRRMVSIALPTVWCKEAAGTTLFIMLFAMQALLNVIRSNADGTVIQALLSRRADRRLRIGQAITRFIASSLFSSCVAGLIEHVRHALIASYRETLTRYFHKRYFDKLTYYRANVLDDRIREADTYITKYCHEFAEHFAELPYYFVLPLMEATTAFTAILTQVGVKPALFMSGVVVVCLGALQRLAPSFGRMHAALLQREDDFRRLHTDVKAKVEQLALHDAGAFTRSRADRSFSLVKEALDQLALAKGHFLCLETTVSTAVWDVVGLIISGVLITNAQGARASVAGSSSSSGGSGSASGGRLGGRTGLLSLVVVQRRLIASFHTAVQAFIVNFKEMSHLSEFTKKLADFDEVLDSLARGEFVRRPDARFETDEGDFRLPSKDEYMALTKAAHQRSDSWHLSVMSPALHHTPRMQSTSELDVMVTSPSTESGSSSNSATAALIEFSLVTVVTPNGVALIEGLDLTIRPRESWAITGPNGCGKSSLLRVLAGMWLPSTGEVTVHPDVAFFFLPQAAYMLSNCTFCEQVTFPDPLERDATGAVVDTMRERIKHAVELAEATQVVEAVLGGWGDHFVGLEAETNTDFDWTSLSGGQQQKTALARMFYHSMVANAAGKFPVAVMDESTSQLDCAAETAVFRNLRDVGVTIISVTHRESVIKHHRRILALTRNASGWSVETARGRRLLSATEDVE